MHLTEAMLHNAAEEVKGFKVETVCCEQPEELIEQLKNRTFDLVFTDIQMPAMNGFELLHHLRNQDFAQAQSIPVIAITARGDMNEDDFQQKGFAGMLQKPFNQSELKKVVKMHCPTSPYRTIYLTPRRFRRKPTKLRHTQTSLITFLR